MKKRLLATLLTLCLIVGLLPTSVLAAGDPGTSADNPLEIPAEAFAFRNGTIGSDTSVGGIRTEWLNTQKEKLGLTSDDTNIWLKLVIPAEIDGVNVTKINRRAFEGKRPYQIASVDFSNATNLKQIGDQAFYLRSETSGSLDLSNTTNLKIDGPYAFSGMGITELILPRSLSSVGDSAFTNNTSLSSVVIPEGITTLGKSMFLGCTSLKNVTLPNSLQTLGEQVFQSSGLTSIELPDRITVIPKAAFRFCSSLERITFSDHVTVIWNTAFESCTSLKVCKPKTDSGDDPVVLPSKLEKLGRQTFKLAFAEDVRIVIPETVTFMGTEVMRSAHITQVVIRYDTAPAEEMFLTEKEANSMSDAGYTNALGFSASAFRPETPLGKRAIIFPNKDVYDAFYSKANFGEQNRDNTYTYPITVNYYSGETAEGNPYRTEEKLYKQSIRYTKQGDRWSYDENYVLPEVPGGAGPKPGYTDSVWMMNGKKLTVDSTVTSDTVTLTGGELVKPEVTFTVEHNPRTSSSWTETVENGSTITVDLAKDQSVDIVPNIQHDLAGNKVDDIFFWYRWQDSTGVRNDEGEDFTFGETINTLRIDGLDEARTSADNQYYYIDIEGKTVGSNRGPSYTFDGSPIYTSDDHTYHIHVNVVRVENLAYVAASDYGYFIEHDPEKYAMLSIYPTAEALIKDYLIGVFGEETYLESDSWAGESLPISWQLKPGTKYSSLPEAENTFVWTVSQADFETLGWTNTNNIPLSGELTLKNPKGVTIVPADITIYTGGEGYTGAVDNAGNQSTTTNGLPEPGYYITLPNKFNAILGGDANAENLSNILKFTYEDDEGRTREWNLELYGTDAHSSNVEGTQRQRYIYRILPGVDENGQEIPVRLQFIDSDGDATTSDEFTPNMKEQYQEYTMRIYSGGLETSKITASLTLPNGQTVTCGVNSGDGKLVVRGLTGEDITTEIVSDEAEISGGGITALAPNDVTYYINGSDVELKDTEGVRLLVDDVLDDDVLVNYIQTNMAEEIPAGDYTYAQQYLDLVDTKNGNAYLTMDEGDKLTVYWNVPDGFDPNQPFYVVHFDALDRNYDKLENELSQNAPDLLAAELVTVKGSQYVKFDASSFSPFVLAWKNQDVPPVPTVKLTYHANHGSEDKLTYYYTDPVVTVKDGLFTRFGYTFNSWNTAPDGNGKTYMPDSTIRMNGDMDLYAQWIKNNDSGDGGSEGEDFTQSEFELHYRTNGGKYLSVESESHVWTKAYEDLPVPVRKGYDFEGWYWDFRLTNPVRGDVKVDGPVVVLYAKWAEEKTTADRTGISRWLDTVHHTAYLSGYPDHSFGADRNMTRAEAAQMFYALLLDKDVKITKTFTDVPTDAWYAKAVNTLASLGMLGGYSDGTFQPERTITRAEFAVVALAFADGGNGASCSFTDVSRNDWFYQYAAQAGKYGWIGGYPDGSFRPNNKITRAEVSVIVNNMLGCDADESFIDRNRHELVRFTDLTDDHWAYYAIMEAANTHTYTRDGSTEMWKSIA